jgi:TonB family protein
MREYRLLQVALLVSFCAHTALIFGSRLFPAVNAPQLEAKTKVSYVKLNDIKKEPPLKLNRDTALVKRIPPPFIEPNNVYREDETQKLRDASFLKPELAKPDIIAVKKKITLPPVDLGKIDNPSYISYYQIVREKIRRCAYQNYTRSETGEVYVAFVISGDGNLKNARLVEEKSFASEYLKTVAVSSVRDASPFPGFPKELDYPELSFNVVISFEIE